MPLRWWRGMTSAAGTLSIPFGRLCCTGIGHLNTQQRLDRGLVIVLPGIQGKSNIESSIARGLEDAGIDMAIEVYDWTTGFWFLFPYHLRALRRNRREAARVAQRVLVYLNQYPDRPVHIIGHSGGAGVALLAMEVMPAGVKATSLILLAPAVSASYDLGRASEHVEFAVWNFFSWFDLLFLVAGSLILGTLDGRHVVSAGASGFRSDAAPGPQAADGCRLRQKPYVARMLRSWNFGGHFGCTNRVFVSEWLAPLLEGGRGAGTPFGGEA